MGPLLLGCVALCLLGAGPTEAEVTQTPRHRITETKKELTVTCSQNMNHDAMYWYRQDPGLGVKLIYYSTYVGLVEKGDVPDGYKASRTEKENFPLTLESASTNQTSLYLCASSQSTALHGQLLCTQKGPPREQGDSSLGRPHPNQEETLPPPSVPTEVPPDSPTSGPLGNADLLSLAAPKSLSKTRQAWPVVAQWRKHRPER